MSKSVRPVWSRQLWRYLRTGLKLLLRRPLPGVTIIPILPDGRIVLVRRCDDGLWSLPGGLVDWGETILCSAQRELKEETGLDWVEFRQLVGVYSDPQRDPRFHSICTTVAATVNGTLKTQDPLEISEVRSFESSAAAQETLAHDHQQQLQDYLQGTTRLA